MPQKATEDNLATIFERVRKLAVNQLGVSEEEVTPSSSFSDDLGADSLDMVELMMALEDEFTTQGRKVNIPDEDAEKIITVQDVLDYIHDKGVTNNEPFKSEEKVAIKTMPPSTTHSHQNPQRPQQNRAGQSVPPSSQAKPNHNRPGGNRHGNQRLPQRQGPPPQQHHPPQPPRPPENQSP